MEPWAWIIIATVANILLNVGLIWLSRTWGRGWFSSAEEERMAAIALKSEEAYLRMEATIDILTRQINDKDKQIAQMGVNSAERDNRIAELTKEVTRLESEVAYLRQQLEEKKLIEFRQPRILALWPSVAGQPPLDQAGESDALYNSGFAYTALRGEPCNRVGVILELDRVRPTIIQIGGHGTAEGLMLSDGIAEPGWWGEAVAGRNIELMVLLSCHSSQQDEINLSDALVRAGVKAVVSCDDAIEDGAAVTFAELLYAKLAEQLPLATAVRRAKLGVSRRSAEMIRLRESIR